MKRYMFAAGALLLSLALSGNALALGTKKKPKKKAKTEKFEVVKPELATSADSLAYIFGVSQSQGLLGYMQQTLGVDTAYMDDFARGIMATVGVDEQDPKAKAYAAGQQIGGQISQMTKQVSNDYYAADQHESLDRTVVAAGILNGLFGTADTKAEDAMIQFRNMMQTRTQANQERLYGTNREAGEQFLAANAKQEGVIVLPSGLQYRVLTQGDGAVPTATQRVKVNYEGHLIDGTEFDSSYKRGEPATFAANQVIKGWTEALTRMPVGSKWQLFIPYDLAYGEREAGQIKPYSALIFTVELLGIE